MKVYYSDSDREIPVDNVVDQILLMFRYTGNYLSEMMITYNGDNIVMQCNNYDRTNKINNFYSHMSKLTNSANGYNMVDFEFTNTSNSRTINFDGISFEQINHVDTIFGDKEIVGVAHYFNANAFKYVDGLTKYKIKPLELTDYVEVVLDTIYTYDEKDYSKICLNRMRTVFGGELNKVVMYKDLQKTLLDLFECIPEEFPDNIVIYLYVTNTEEADKHKKVLDEKITEFNLTMSDTTCDDMLI